jgi:transposase
MARRQRAFAANNITLITPPPFSPELKPVENV